MNQNRSAMARGVNTEAGLQGLSGSRSGQSVVPGRWIEAARMVEVWLPDYFRPEYDTLDESLADVSLRWVKLGDLVAQHSAAVSSTSETNFRWRAQATTTSLEIKEHLASGHASTTDLMLPDNAIIVRLGGASLIQVEYWDSSIYPGGGVASPDLLVLTTSHSVDPAWLVWELRTNAMIKLQVERSTFGTTIPRVDRSHLLGLQLQVAGADEQIRCANAVRGIIRENQSLARAQAIIEAAKRTQRAFIVTGVTVQDRLRQFEEYLLKEEWITPRSLFCIEKVEDEQKFILQPIQRVGSYHRSTAGSVMTRRPVELEADRDWLDWSVSTDVPWKLFNSLLGKEDLPPAILTRILTYSESDIGDPSASTSVPSFDTWRQLYRSIWDLQGTLSPSDWSQITRTWLTQSPEIRHPDTALEPRDNRHAAPIAAEESILIGLVRRVSRPIVALKAICENQVVRIYLILGPDQTDDPLHSAALLEGYASILAENLHQATHFAAEAAKMESIRRLSWLRHHLNGPIGIISNAVADIVAFRLTPRLNRG